MMNNTLKTVIPFSATTIFLYIAFRNIDLSSFWISLQNTSVPVIVAASGMAIMSMFLRAWRWQILLNPLKAISYRSVFSFTMIGFMANNILPAHAGEFIKPYLLGKKEGISGVSALATVLIERLLDSISLIFLLLMVLLAIPAPDWLKYGGIAIGAGSLLSILLLILLAPQGSPVRETLLRWAEKLPQKIRGPVRDKVQTFLLGLNIFQRWQNLFPLLAISILIWIHMSATIYIVLKGFPLSADVNANLGLASVVVIVFLAFAIVLPSSPGYIGITQVGFKIALGFFAISEADAVGCSVIFNLTQYIPITVGGLLLLMNEGLTFKQLRSETETG